MDPDFNSSDVDLGPAPERPYQSAGKSSLERMLDNAFEDRIESKRVTKNLTFSRGAPGTQYAHSLWYNRFSTFYTGTLGLDSGRTPQGIHIERFLTAVVSHVTPKNSTGLPCVKWMVDGLCALIASLVFEYENFRLSPRERSRLVTLIDKLFKDGKLTKETAREAQWIGAQLIKRMMAAFIQEALSEGTRSWDVTASKVLSMVLLAACAARAGDIVRSRLYEGLVCLCYKDIVMEVRDNSVASIRVVVTLRFEKYEKTTTNNRRIVLTALANPDDNVVCPVKLLLIQALRLNHTSSTTVQQILATASCRQDRKIVWKSTSMDLPVIPAIAQGGSRLRTEHPAQPSQISESVKAAANTLGILVPVTSHDVRRGSARDVAFLEKVPGTSTRSAAAALGHSDAARRSGVTSKYIGPVKEDLWSKRLEATTNDDDPFAPAVGGSPIKKRKISATEVNKWCDDNDLDSHLDKNRKKARYHLGKDAMQAARDKLAEATAVFDDDGADDPVLSGAVAEDDDNMRTEMIENSLSAGTNDPHQRRILLECIAPSTGGSLDDQMLTAGAVEFVTAFATINVVKGMSTGGQSGSKEGVTPFLYECVNKVNGCDYTNYRPDVVKQHSLRCLLTAPKPPPLTKAFPCEVLDCKSSFDYSWRLTAHMRRHNWIPKPCVESDCESTKIFPSKATYDKHRSDAHGSYTPRLCGYLGCENTTIWKTRGTHSQHLERTHLVIRKDQMAYLYPKD